MGTNNMNDKNKNYIGTYSEKSIHSELKNFYESDKSKQEIPVDKYIADIFNGKEIIEIQTGQFYRLKEKLDCFLKKYPVTVVYPISAEKWVCWVDAETGEIAEKRKSPKKENEYTAFYELYKIKKYLKHPNFKMILLLLEVEEYKLLDGYGKNKKNHATKFDKKPLNISRKIILEKKEDYMQFIPYDLEDGFTSVTFSKKTHISKSLGTVVLNVLNTMEVVERIGKEVNLYLYNVIFY